MAFFQAPPPAVQVVQNSPSQVYPHPVHHSGHEQEPPTYQFPSSPTVTAHPQAMPQDQQYQLEIQARTGMVANGSTPQAIHYPNGYVPAPQHASEMDAHYWKNMFLELGFGEGVDPSMSHMVPIRPMPPYMDPSHHQHQQQHHATPQHLPHPSHAHQTMHPHGQMQYHTMHPTTHQPYGH